MQRHPLDVISLVFGVLFLTVAAVFLLGNSPAARLDSRWVVPAALILLGVVLLVSMAADLRRSADGPGT